MLKLVNDADLFRGRSAAGCRALEARSSWLVGIRFEGKSGHLECAEIIENIQEALRWLLAAQLDCKERWQRRGNRRVHIGFSHCPRRTEIRPMARRAVLFSPAS